MYDNTVKTESNALQTVISNEIIPRCYEFLRLVEPVSKSAKINQRSDKFVVLFEELVEREEQLKELHGKSNSLEEISNLRR